MPTDLYDDGPAEDQTEMPGKGDNQDTDDSGKTALIPSSLCPGLKVGETIALEIVAVNEDEYQVKYSHDEEGEDESEEPSMSQASENNKSPMGDYME
jgi:hypothetical protein